MRYLLLLFLGCCLFSVARADDDAEGPQPAIPPATGAVDPEDLSFWSIAASDFYADKPRPLSIPGVGGRMEYYWYWTFKFRYRTNLELLNKYLAEMQKRLEKNDAKNDADMLKADIARLQTAIKKINQEATNDDDEDEKNAKLEKQRWNLSMYVTLRTDTDQILPDISNEVVRNLVERQESRRFYTTKEIQRLKKKDVKETFDPDYGKGRWVNGIAIFSGMKPQSRMLELRVTGMGQRVMPTFVPGQLIYSKQMLSMGTALQPTLRRALRFFYHKVGQSGEAHLDTVDFVSRSAEWLWVWPLQIYPGCFREVTIERDPEIEGVEPIKRRYIYLPYFIWNNTAVNQDFAVRQAGIVEDVKWGGEKIRVVIYDDGGADARWKNQVLHEIRKRQEDGKEKEFVEENELYPVRYDDTDIQKYYEENFKADSSKNLAALPYKEADNGEAVDSGLQEELREKQQKLSNEMKKELQAKKDADADRKAKFAVKDDNRLFVGTIPQGQLESGVAIMQWGVTDIDALIDKLIASLQMRALLNQPADEGDVLYKEYQKIRQKPLDANRPWTAKAEPSRLTIVEMLARIAEKDLQEKDIKVSEDDVRRYGPAAPLGALFNQLAWERIQERAKLGVTDLYFNVKTQGANDTAYITAQFQRYLPEPAASLPPVPDDFAKVGTREGAATGGGVEDAKADDEASQTKEEDLW